MLFHEPFFALLVFPAFYALCLICDAHTALKKWALILGSIAFYTWGELLFVPVVLASALLDYVLTRLIAHARADTLRRGLVAAGIAANLAILVFYKYADFLLANFNLLIGPLSGRTLPLLHIALPIGVSFVVFEKITYLVDCYRGTTPPARTFSDYCLFVFLFPKLLAGPILKYHEMQTQIADPAPIRWDDFCDGFLRFARGMAKKVLIADPVGAFADQVFGADPASLGAGAAWLGLLCFTLQIYFDFSAYSDMAIGLARMLGFRLRENFNMPYVSRSLTEFWRRWHISLATFIRDYLYVPLGGSRAGAMRTYINLWICFLLSGIWHGANWNFLLWGAYNGLFLTLDRLFLLKLLERAGALVSTAATLLIVMVGWTIFRSTTLDQMGGMFIALVDFSRPAGAVELPPDVPLTAAIGTLLCLIPATPLYAPLLRSYETNQYVRAVAAFALIVLYFFALGRALAIPFKPFIYFRF